jgi:2-keto-4-pentenoate hydratase/2-oxohepta-3-ene-1,7-dioic acid hydratase in catechol pathway
MTSFGIATITRGGEPVVAVSTANGVRPLTSLLRRHARLGEPPASARSMLSRWDEWCDAIDEALAADEGTGWIREGDVEFDAPIGDPSAIYCAGANYRDHMLEMGGTVPTEPFHFLVPPAALTGHRRAVPRPAGCSQLDWEVELAVIMGSTADHVAEEHALDCVAGYAVANDISARDPELLLSPAFGVRWLTSKGQTGLQPIGPALVPARFVENPMDLELGLSVNGSVKQQSNTSQMVFSIAEQIAYLSRLMPLRPGDLILTGTPAGTAAAHGAYLADGDRITATVEAVGTLTNEITPARTSA